MTTEEALALLEIEWPRSNKLSCPKHSDSDPSLHLYPEDRGFYCFSCNEGGDGLSLLSHFTGKPLGELMSEHGIKLGPRGRSKWQQVADIQTRMDEAQASFTLGMRKLWGKAGFQHIAAHAERVEHLWPELLERDPDAAPFELHRQVRELESYLRAELERSEGAYHSFVSSGRDQLQGPELRSALLQDGRRGGGSVRVRLSRPDGGVRLA